MKSTGPPTGLRMLREEEGESHSALTDEMFAALLCPARLGNSSNR